MPSLAGGYYGKYFKGFRGGTQGAPLSITILNVVVDVVIQHWVNMVTVTEEAVPPRADTTEGFWRDVHRLTAYFYADDGILASTRATRLQQAFDTLKKLFELVGLRTNVAKMVIMACKICHVIGVHSAEAYGLWMMGEGQCF